MSKASKGEAAPAAAPAEVAQVVSTPGDVTPAALMQRAAPAAQPEQQAEQAINPLLDRSVLEEPVEQEAEQEATGTHLEEDSTPEDTVEEVEEAAEPASLEEMVGAELMQDPGCSLVAKGLLRICGDKVDHNRAFGKALENDDARFIDEGYLRETLGDDADEAIASAEFLLDYAGTYAQNIQTKLYESVEGGQEAVQLASKHFNSTASDSQKQLVSKLLDSGNLEYMQHAVQLIVESAKGVMPKHKQQTFGAPTGIQPISRQEFGKAVLDNPNMNEQEYNKLRAQLAAGLR